jgi:hypothetical protein
MTCSRRVETWNGEIYPPVDKLNCPDLNVMMEVFSDYLAHFLCFERLRKLVDPVDGFNGLVFYTKKCFLAPALQETYYFQQVTGWSGTRQFELLTRRRSGDGVVKDDKWEEAEWFVHDALANTSTMKLSHGPAGALGSFLADLWNMPEHCQKDNMEGTLASYLRHESTHFEQTRELKPLKPMKWDDATEKVVDARCLEPVSNA